MKKTFRCACPVTSALDIFGDKWSLVLVKQMLFEHKSTFKDFVESPESFATNILSSRLKTLEEFGIIEKTQLPNNRKTNIYSLTEKGMSLAPVLLELTLWGRNNLQESNPNLNVDPQLDQVENNKEHAFALVIKNYKDYKQAVLNG